MATFSVTPVIKVYITLFCFVLFFPSIGNYWNAASFPNPSSYLHFSTFQGETSADISFYFKTLIPRGVFLENLGNTDFIKLELKCEYKLSTLKWPPLLSLQS